MKLFSYIFFILPEKKKDYPIYPFMIPRLLFRTNIMISSLSFDADISASIRSIASDTFRPD